MGGKGRGVEVAREDERMRRTRGHGRIATVADTLWRAVSGLGVGQQRVQLCAVSTPLCPFCWWEFRRSFNSGG